MQRTVRLRSALARRSAGALIAVLGLGFGFAACGEEEDPASFSDSEIRKALSLEDVQGTLAVNGDIFCEVRPEFLNDTDEVSDALDRDNGLVLTSIQGNVGIQVVPPFAKDCEAKVRRELKALDPTNRQERRKKKEPAGGGGGGSGAGDGDGDGSGEDGASG